MPSDPEEIILTVPEGHPPDRLDRFISGSLARSDLSRSRVQSLLKQQHIMVDGITAKARLPVAAGMQIIINLPASQSDRALPEPIALSVLHEDADIIVVDKPHGMVVHPAAGNACGTLVNALLHHCGQSLSGIGGIERPGIVHRLDKDTSGCLVAAKNDRAHQGLVAQFANRTAKKSYLAAVHGIPRPQSGQIATRIGRDPHNRLRMATVPAPKGKEAITDYQVVTVHRDCALVRCCIQTGRTHQIRVHMRHLGHAVLGDPIYAHPTRQPVAVARLMLHARRLEIDHPCTGERMIFEAPLPDVFDPWKIQEAR